MRLTQKQQIEALICQMKKAHEQVRLHMERGNIQPAAGLLEDCQMGGITMGTLIENTEGQNHQAVLLLEEYCELIYLIYQKLKENYEKISVYNMYDMLHQKICKVANIVKHDVMVTKEAVFLPYKASMWDSMESVWKAASEDKYCDAYVIPVPYFDKDSNGKFCDMHYEGDQYPDYVPVTRYDEFDLEEHHPDMIFIHNPYDMANYVTSVHPFFYSDKLKKITNQLVYLPYFMLEEISPEDDAAVENIKHFCTVPGVYHADKVIVQSEAMKQVYVRVLSEAAGSHTQTARKYWNDKISGLGSPKIDKILNTKKEDFSLPQKWKDIIEKPDGSWKKIIFYNTGIGALLNQNERMLDKMRDVFRVFKENKDKVALLWRPHPLIQATVKSMRPGLWIEYDRLIRQYQAEGWGIYDDSTDLDRAVAIGTAYYGDTSSVIQLCKKAGKKVLLEQAFIKDTEDDKYLFAFEDLYDDGSCYWFTAMNYNALFKLHKDTWLVEYIGSFPNERTDGYRLYSSILEHRDKLYFTPLRADEIGVFDKKKQQFSKIVFENEKKECLDDYTGWNFVTAYRHKSFLYFIPHQRKFILKLNMETGDISFQTDWYKMLRKKGIHTGESLFFKTCRKENVVYAPFNHINAVLMFNLQTEKAELFTVGDTGTGYVDICYDGGKFWLAPLTGRKIFRWDEKTNICESFLVTSARKENMLFWGCEYFDDSVYFFPNAYNKILKIDVSESHGNDLVIEESAGMSDENRDVLCSNYVFCKSELSHMLTYDKDGYLSEYRKGVSWIRKEVIRLLPDNKNKFTAFIGKLQDEYYRHQEGMPCETVYFSLRDFIRHIIDDPDKQDGPLKERKESYGEKIYRILNQ